MQLARLVFYRLYRYQSYNLSVVVCCFVFLIIILDVDGQFVRFVSTDEVSRSDDNNIGILLISSNITIMRRSLYCIVTHIYVFVHCENLDSILYEIQIFLACHKQFILQYVRRRILLMHSNSNNMKWEMYIFLIFLCKFL